MNNIQDKKIIISGGAGFIGHHLITKLAKNNQIFVIDNLTRGAKRRIECSENIVFFHVDITNLDEMLDMNKHADIFIHLAAINGTQNFYDRPIEVMDVGVMGAINVFKYCSKMNIEKVVTASSAEVYQAPKIVPTPEDIELIVPSHSNPRYSYGLSKIFTEFYSVHYGASKGISVSSFRPHNVFGPDMGYKHVIPEFIIPFINAKIEDKSFVEIEAKGDLSAERAFCYVSDIIEGIQIISDLEVDGVFNIGNIISISMIEILDILSNISDIEYTISSKSANTHIGAVKQRIPDISKISSLGYQPKVDLESGLLKTYQWYLENYEKNLQERANKYL
jgi:UDP-glucose 4-epimerase